MSRAARLLLSSVAAVLLTVGAWLAWSGGSAGVGRAALGPSAADAAAPRPPTAAPPPEPTAVDRAPERPDGAAEDEAFPHERFVTGTTTVVGRVIEEDGAGAAGATVVAVPAFLRVRPRTATAGPDGRFVLPLPRRLVTEELATNAVWRIHAVLGERRSTDGDDLLLERPGQRHVRPLVLRPEIRIAGRVVDPDGRSVAGAEVTDLTTGRVVATSGEEGRFEGRPTWRLLGETVLVASADGFGPSRSPFPTRELRPGDVWEGHELVLDRLVALEGRAVRHDGAPVGALEVRSHRLDSVLRGPIRVERLRRLDQTITDRAGAFRIRVPEDGPFSIEALELPRCRSIFEFEAVPSSPLELTVAEPGPSAGVPVVLRLLDERTEEPIETLEHVWRIEGEARTLLGHADLRLRASRLLPAGDFRVIVADSAEPIRLAARAPGTLVAESAPFRVRPDVVVPILLPAGGRVSGTVRAASTGGPIPFASVRVESWPEGRILRRTRTTADGTFEESGFTSSRARVVAWDSEHAPAWSAPIEVGPRLPEARVDLLLVAGGRLVGRVTHGGLPVPDQPLSVSRDGHTTRTRTDASGSYRFGPLTPGRWSLEVEAEAVDREAGPTALAALDLEEGREAVHDVALDRFGIAAPRGTVRRGGRPVPDVEVALLRPPDEEVAEAPTGPDGRFVLPAARPGTYVLEVRRPPADEVVERRRLTVRSPMPDVHVALADGRLTVAVARRDGAEERLVTAVELERFDDDPFLLDDAFGVGPWRSDFRDRYVREGEVVRYDGLPVGRYRISAVPFPRRGELVTRRRVVVVRDGVDTRAELVLSPPCRLTVRPRSPLPLEHELHLRSTDDDSVLEESGGDPVEFGPIPPGSYRLFEVRRTENDAAWLELRSWPIDLVGGQRLELTIDGGAERR